MANFLEDAIKAYNGLNNNNSDLQRGTKLAETYRDLAMDITKGYTNLPKSQDERISYEPKTVTADVIRDDVENNIRPQIHDISYEENKTPYKDKDMDEAEENSNTTWDREDI